MLFYIYIKIQSHEISQNNIMARKKGGHGKKKKRERKENRKERKKIMRYRIHIEASMMNLQIPLKRYYESIDTM